MHERKVTDLGVIMSGTNSERLARKEQVPQSMSVERTPRAERVVPATMREQRTAKVEVLPQATENFVSEAGRALQR